ncbi:hypothetical protein EV183_001097 [Coemansia sp. RSA 2336]|nr:hypothetical protein EV183_001097 [Coemansia sp. RSA 2336]
MPAEKGDYTRRESLSSDFSPGDDFGPLDENFKPGSTRARFEELASTYRSSNDKNGRMLSRFDEMMQKKASLVNIVRMAKGGELPPTRQIVENIHKINFDAMREHATTFQGKKVIDNLESATNSGAKAFEEINGEDNAQAIITDLDSVRRKTVDDRKVLARKAKQHAEGSRDTAKIAGKDFMNIGQGIGTSSTFRKALADLLNLVNDTIQNKDAKEGSGESLVDRIRNLVVEVRENPRVRTSLGSLHSVYRTTYERSTMTAKDAEDQFKDHPANEDLADARHHAQTLFTKLGNGYDLAALTAAITAIGKMTRDNEGFRKLADETQDFGTWAMDVDADELTSEEFKTRSQHLIDKSHEVLSDEERTHFRILSSETTNYMHAVRDNPLIDGYKTDMVALAHSITGSELNAEERREHYRALREDVMANLPVLIQTIRYIPLPRIAGQNKEIEFAADNVVLDLKHFVPERMSLNSHSEIYPRAKVLGEKSATRSKQGFHGEQYFTLTLTGIHFVAKRVAFYIKKKKGMPRLAEKGIADMLVGGRGMDVVMQVRRLHGSEKPKVPAEKTGSSKGKETEGTSPLRSKRELDIVDVNVKLHDLDIKVKENKHNISGALALALMKPVARKLIAKNIAKALTENLIAGDQLMAKYGTTAQGFVMDSGKKAMSSAKGAAKKGAKKSKEQISKAKSSQNKSARRDSLVEESNAVAQEA